MNKPQSRASAVSLNEPAASSGLGPLDVPSEPLNAGPQATLPQSIGPWSIREVVLASGALVLAIAGWLELGALSGDNRYGFVAIVAGPLAVAAWVLARRMVRVLDVRVAGLDADQWAAAVALNALVFALMLSSSDPGPGSAFAVFGAVAMIAATVASRFIPAFRGEAPARESRAASASSSTRTQPITTARAPGGDPSPTVALNLSTNRGGASVSASRTGSSVRPIPPQARGARPLTAQAPIYPAPQAQPFWFAVPERRPVTGGDGRVIGYAEPGRWILAREDRGDSFLVELDGGLRGVLRNISDIERA